MASIEATSKVAYDCVPAIGLSVYILTYTKNTQNDTIALATYTPIKTVMFVIAQDDAAGNDDPVTWSGTALTLTSADTGAGHLLVVGKC